MKTLKVGSESVTLELTLDELILILNCYLKSHRKNNKKENGFFEELYKLLKHMDYLKEVEAAITEAFNKK